MKQIKPEVIGYQQVFTDGSVSDIVFKYIEAITNIVVDESIELHENGKQKVCLVYKKEIQ